MRRYETSEIMGKSGWEMSFFFALPRRRFGICHKNQQKHVLIVFTLILHILPIDFQEFHVSCQQPSM